MNYRKPIQALMLLLISFQVSLFAQQDLVPYDTGRTLEGDYSYNSPQGKENFRASNVRIAVKLPKEAKTDALQQIEKQFRDISSKEGSQLHELAGYTLFSINAKIKDSKSLSALIEKINTSSLVEAVSPVLLYEDQTAHIPTQRIIIKLKSLSTLDQLKNDAQKFGLTLSKAYAYDQLVYFGEIKKGSALDAIQISQRLYETGKYQAVEPELIRILAKMNTNDPFLGYQWSLNNTGSANQYNGTPGADMNVFNAWNLVTGSSTIKVAVIDEGVDLNHPDLAANLLPGFDATGLGSNGGPQGNDAHGTGCAGIIGAIGNNGLGLAGVAYGVKIVPIRIAYSSNSSWVTNDTWISTAIDWAWNNGAADVLSNSWGGGPSSTLINDAIGRAVTQGRNGKGSPVIFAAGNFNSSVSFPASNNNTIAVIAMSMCNQRKSYTSCDGESWGSNYGTNADVAAPGVKIFTTDISGTAGYSIDDYYPTFNGTSSACPNTAGVMALILSANPALTMTQARQILESSCEKVGGYGYISNPTNQPNGTWSNDLGYGRVNAYAAVQMALGMTCNGAPPTTTVLATSTSFCVPTNVTFSLQSAYNSGTSFQWETSTDGLTYSPVTGATANNFSVTINTNLWVRCAISCGSNTTTTAASVITYIDPTVVNYPHTEKFNASSLPCGWSVQNVNGDANTWVVSNSGPRTSPYGPSYAKNATQAANDWLFSLPLSMTAGNSYGVRFWYRGNSTTLPEMLEVKWGNAPNANAMTSNAVFSNTAIGNATYSVANSAVITPASTGIYYVGFRVFSNANMGNLRLDDITFELVSPCNTPLNGGVISGPSTIYAGNGTLSTFSVTGQNGNDVYWQISANGGTSWTTIPGLVTSIVNTSIAAPGSYLLRVVTGSYNCADAYSPDFPVTVIPRIGDLISNPIIAQHEFYAQLNTGAGSGFNNDYTGPNNQASNDVFFRYTTGACTDSIIIGTCGSGFDTYLHILDANGVHITSMDDGPRCGQQTVMVFDAAPSTTYYIVLEGWNTSSGYAVFGIREYMNMFNTVNITSSADTMLCGNQSLTLTATAGQDYFWSNGGNTQSIVVNQPGEYSVRVYDNVGCVGRDTITITQATPQTWYPDNDGDGWGQIEAPLLACSQPTGYVLLANDCDDNNPAIHDTQLYYADLDGDGFGGQTTGSFCLVSPPTGWVTNNQDCDDNNAAVYTPYTYYLDADGDGFGSQTIDTFCSAIAPPGYANNNTDCDDNNAVVHVPLTYYVDADGDGFGSTTTAALCSAAPPVGYASNNTDCDDNNATVNTPITYYMDADGDGFGSTTTASLCSASAPSGYASNNTDCDDNNAAVHTPITYYVDADGDGFGSTTSASLCAATPPSGFASNNTDCDDNNAAIHTPITYYVDADGDGFGSTTSASLCAATAPSGYASNNTDCDDNNAAVNTLITYYVDADGDGFGSSTTASLCAATPPSGYASNNTDCDDNNAAINPAAQEICGNGVDDNCNQQIDEMCCNITLSATIAPTLCSNVATGSINLTATNGANPYTYLWSNTATTEDLANIGSGTYSVTVTDANGCTKTGSFVVSSSNQAPTTPLQIDGPSGACRNQTNVVFSVPAVTGATSYIWTLPSGASGSSNTNSISLNFSNTYNTGNLCVKAVNACGQSANFCRQVLRYTNAPATPGTISGLSQGVCPNTTQTYTINPVNNATSYTWTAPANASVVSGQGSTTVTIAFSAGFGTSGVLSVKAVNCIGSSGNRNLTIQRNPAQPSAIQSVSSVCPNAQGVVFSVTNVPGYTYNWVVPNGCTIVSGQGSNSVVVNWGASSGSIAVQASVPCGAVSSFRSKFISVVSCTSALPKYNPMALESVDLYPNPASQQATLFVSSVETGSYLLEIFDLQGRLIQRENGMAVRGNNEITLDLSAYTSGMYWLRFTHQNGNFSTQKLIIE